MRRASTHERLSRRAKWQHKLSRFADASRLEIRGNAETSSLVETALDGLPARADFVKVPLIAVNQTSVNISCEFRGGAVRSFVNARIPPHLGDAQDPGVGEG